MTTTFNLSEIIDDIKLVENNKKAIASKYGIQSNKCAEIQRTLWIMANDIRRTHTTFTIEDVKIFNRRWDVPYSPKKIREAMADESDAFVAFYLGIIENAKSVYDWRTHNTRVNTLRSILVERSKANNDTLQQLKKTLTEQTYDFRTTYIDSILERANEIFTALESKYHGIRTTADLIAAFNPADDKEFNKIRINFAKARNFTHHFDKVAFLDYQGKKANKEFDESISLIADRIESKGMAPKDVIVKKINDNDAKAFDIHVTDGKMDLHARSIFCAEFSDLVTPHWRFIITNE